MKLTDEELKSTKIALTNYLESYADPRILSSVLAKDLAYLKLDFFDTEPEAIYPFQTALRKIIEETIMRQVKNDS